MKKNRIILSVVIFIIILSVILFVLYYFYSTVNIHNNEYSFDLLTNLNINAVCSVKKFNDIDVENIVQPFIIYTNQFIYKKKYPGSIERNLFLIVKGWAIDPVANSIAGDVVIEVNRNQYRANYGLPSINVTNLPVQITNSGFECFIPLSDLSYFPRTLTVKVINKSKTGYYIYPKNYTFLVMESPLPDFKETVQSDQITRYNIDIFNGIPISKNGVIEINRNSSYFQIIGWAIDSVEGYIAGGVYISVDSNDIPAVYGFERTDVAKFFDNLQYTFSGFQANIPADTLSNGLHTLSLKILKYNKKAFYTPDKEYQFEIK